MHKVNGLTFTSVKSLKEMQSQHYVTKYFLHKYCEVITSTEFNPGSTRTSLLFAFLQIKE